MHSSTRVLQQHRRSGLPCSHALGLCCRQRSILMSSILLQTAYIP